MPDGIDLQGIGGFAGVGPTGRKIGGGAGDDGVSFKDVLFSKVAEVNNLQQEAEAAMKNFAAGKTENMSEMFLAIQKADLAFKTLMVIRNKLMEAYREIQQMRL